ncbi:hypothetical protein ACH5RR_039755 [Cinchona calisaya]|uniref:Uncharacterized protein n=1 Tax=Cinchona calisaya TaxID=153742 RepID=A0ABD2Y2J2_9GENT
MAKDKDSVKGRILNFEESIMKESKTEDQVSLGSYAILANEMLPKSLTEKTFEMMTIAIQNSVAVSIDLAQIVQRAGETASQYMERFKTAKMRCNARIPEEEFVSPHWLSSSSRVGVTQKQEGGSKLARIFRRSVQIIVIPVWNRDKVEMIKEDPKTFMARVHTVEAVYYYGNIGPHRIVNNKIDGKPKVVGCSICQYGRHANSSQDDMTKVDLGDSRKSWPTYICAHLTAKQKEQVTQLLKEFINCFAWDYTKMPGLDRKLVEHKILLKPGFKPYNQP